jgi:xanthine/uracil/vitamin C permease (AzgA family)
LPAHLSALLSFSLLLPQVINIVKIRWENVQEAVPAFLTMITMPITYSGDSHLWEHSCGMQASSPRLLYC